MSEYEIKLAERLGLSHKAPGVERRAFLRGMAGIGALLTLPSGLLALPESKVYQVPAPTFQPSRAIRLWEGLLAPAVVSMDAHAKVATLYSADNYCTDDGGFTYDSGRALITEARPTPPRVWSGADVKWIEEQRQLLFCTVDS